MTKEEYLIKLRKLAVEHVNNGHRSVARAFASLSKKAWTNGGVSLQEISAIVQKAKEDKGAK